MSQKFNVIFALIAAAATVGAVELAGGEEALGRNLVERFQAVSEPQGAAGVNREAKANREATLRAAEPSRTFQLKVESLADTSVLIRLPLEKEARNLAPAQPSAKPAKPVSKRMTVACEPVVSVLTEVAKLLQPGRCVT